MTGKDLNRLETQIGQAMRADRFRLKRWLRRLRDRAQRRRLSEEELRRFEQELETSVKLRRTRLEKLPFVEILPNLPISAKRDEIAEAIRANPVVIVCGETGSGKSTQLPKICLQLGRGIEGLIGHTQPRRIAARSIATRIAQELGVSLGREVGYKVRFSEVTCAETYIKLMTDGILLAETQGDRYLEKYDTIIIDEAHERSLNIDFLLGYLRTLLTKRRDLKVIITSATLDAERFSAHFAHAGRPAPVIEVPGRSYPVEVRYRPPEPDESTGETDWQSAVVAALEEVLAEGPGDVLVFMPTERHIHETMRLLKAQSVTNSQFREIELLPLYARLSAGDQQRIFQPHKQRRIVIATNVAESSLTVPGIRYVVDPGVARISRYSPRTKTQRLPIEPISQASAEQRKGRCGREGPGLCLRLFIEEDLALRDRYTPPEILRTNLASVILQLMALKLGEVETFPFLDPPRADAIRDGYKTLFEIGAVDESGKLTDLGRRLAKLPVDPRIGRMILAAHEEGCLHEVLIIAAALETDDPRLRPADRAEEADLAHAAFRHTESDFLGYLKLWDFYQNLKGKLSRNQLQKACQQNFLSYNRLREWADIFRELQQIVAESGMKLGKRRDDPSAIHRAILTGLLSNVAMRHNRYEYTVAGGGKAYLWPGSGVFQSRPAWVVAAELVETGRRYLRVCAKIDPAWVEELAPHFVKKTYVDPFWSRRYGKAMVYEKVTLFGLPVVPRRRTPLGPVDPQAARQMLIQHGLIEGEINCDAAFFLHNQRLVRDMETVQIKLRRTDLLLGQWAQFDFYDQRIPSHIYDLQALLHWWKEASKSNSAILDMQPSDVVREEPPPDLPKQFPDHLLMEKAPLPLTYHFQPGHSSDGVTLTVPVEVFHCLDPQRLDWLVPGMLEGKVAALIKSLPKEKRRRLIPVQETARQACQMLRFGEGRFLPAVADVLSRLAGETIHWHEFQLDKIPPEFQMCIQVIDAEGKVLVSGRNWMELREKLGRKHAVVFSLIDDPQWNRDGLKSWDFDILPREIEVRRGDIPVKAYPMLVDAGSSVSLRLADSAARAAYQSRFGIRRFLVIMAQSHLDPRWDEFPDRDRLRLVAATLPNFDFRDQLLLLLIDRAFLDESLVGPWTIGDWGNLPRTRTEYQHLTKAGLKRLPLAIQEVLSLIRPLLDSYHQATLALQTLQSPQWEESLADMSEQLAELTTPGFLTHTPWSWLRHYPRYFRGICRRVEALRLGGIFRDREAMAAFRPHWERFLERRSLHEEMDIFDPELLHYRWMLEEFRISLFAQSLGTALPVSAQRLDRQLARVRGTL
ncbi:MAG: ATP-dependent RNA helicase HrpA [Thermogutta sp.]